VKRGWIVATVVFFALFCFTIWQSLSLPQMDDLGPGPGFFPLWLALIGAVLSLLLVIETARLPALGDGVSLIPDGAALYRIFAIVLLLAASAAALDYLGWRLTALLLSAILLPALGARSPLIVIPFAVAAGFGVFHVFYYWLKVPLPIGTFGI
jgi:putative tricarboxylic transport membrane protein